MEEVLGKILFVDDEAFEFELMRRALSKTGIDAELFCFSSAGEDIRLFKGDTG